MRSLRRFFGQFIGRRHIAEHVTGDVNGWGEESASFEAIEDVAVQLAVSRYGAKVTDGAETELCATDEPVREDTPPYYFVYVTPLLTHEDESVHSLERALDLLRQHPGRDALTVSVHRMRRAPVKLVFPSIGIGFNADLEGHLISELGFGCLRVRRVGNLPIVCRYPTYAITESILRDSPQPAVLCSEASLAAPLHHYQSPFAATIVEWGDEGVARILDDDGREGWISDRILQQPFSMYCVKCRARREVGVFDKKIMRNKRPAFVSTCTYCGTKMFKIGGPS